MLLNLLFLIVSATVVSMSAQDVRPNARLRGGGDLPAFSAADVAQMRARDREQAAAQRRPVNENQGALPSSGRTAGMRGRTEPLPDRTARRRRPNFQVYQDPAPRMEIYQDPETPAAGEPQQAVAVDPNVTPIMHLRRQSPRLHHHNMHAQRRAAQEAELRRQMAERNAGHHRAPVLALEESPKTPRSGAMSPAVGE